MDEPNRQQRKRSGHNDGGGFQNDYQSAWQTYLLDQRSASANTRSQDPVEPRHAECKLHEWRLDMSCHDRSHCRLTADSAGNSSVHPQRQYVTIKSLLTKTHKATGQK